MTLPPPFRMAGPLCCEHIDGEAVVVVETLVQNMERIQREALLLHRIDHLSYSEIAKRLSLPKPKVIRAIAEAVAELANGLAMHRFERGDVSETRMTRQYKVAIIEGATKWET